MAKRPVSGVLKVLVDSIVKALGFAIGKDAVILQVHLVLTHGENVRLGADWIRCVVLVVDDLFYGVAIKVF